jgi:hypothetical protein
MTSEEAALAVIDGLEALQVPYMLVGSFSSNYYGIPRSTKDADFMVHIDPQAISHLAERLGPRFQLHSQLSFETVTMTTRSIIQVVDTLFKIELFYLGDDPHDQERFRRRVRVPSLNRVISLPTPEDVIITKLRWCHGGRRSKDWEDVRNVIAVQSDRLDWAYIQRWCDQHGTRALLDEIRQSIPPL